MAGYPRVIGYRGAPHVGYVAGHYYPGTGVYGAAPVPQHPHPMAMMMAPPVHPMAVQPHDQIPVIGPPPPVVHSPPWRPMMAPGSPPLGEGHVPLPLTAETYGGSWGNTAGGGAPSGTTIIWSARPQKPFKANRIIARGTKSGPSAIGNIIAQVFVGTDLQQGELGFFDLESIGAANAFDTWISFKQVEPGVWLRLQGQLTAYPTGTDFETYTISVLGHYLH